MIDGKILLRDLVARHRREQRQRPTPEQIRQREMIAALCLLVEEQRRAAHALHYGEFVPTGQPFEDEDDEAEPPPSRLGLLWRLLWMRHG